MEEGASIRSHFDESNIIFVDLEHLDIKVDNED